MINEFKGIIADHFSLRQVKVGTVCDAIILENVKEIFNQNQEFSVK